MADVKKRVHHEIRSQLGISDGAELNDTDTIEKLGGDSLDMVELVMNLEEEFDIDISDSEYEPIQTVGELVTLVEGKVS